MNIKQIIAIISLIGLALPLGAMDYKSDKHLRMTVASLAGVVLPMNKTTDEYLWDGDAQPITKPAPPYPVTYFGNQSAYTAYLDNVKHYASNMGKVLMSPPSIIFFSSTAVYAFDQIMAWKSIYNQLKKMAPQSLSEDQFKTIFFDTFKKTTLLSRTCQKLIYSFMVGYLILMVTNLLRNNDSELKALPIFIICWLCRIGGFHCAEALVGYKNPFTIPTFKELDRVRK